MFFNSNEHHRAQQRLDYIDCHCFYMSLPHWEVGAYGPPWKSRATSDVRLHHVAGGTSDAMSSPTKKVMMFPCVYPARNTVVSCCHISPKFSYIFPVRWAANLPSLAKK